MNHDERALLEANENYYRAFISNDYQAMELLWDNDEDIAVIHPGWEPLHGYKNVMRSWKGILAGPGSQHLQCINAMSYIMHGTGFVICIERLPEGMLAATNVFTSKKKGWKLVHHQAGPVAQDSQDIPVGPVH